MSQFDATRRGSSCLNCVKIRCLLGLHPRQLTALPRPLAAFKRREGSEGRGNGRGGEREEREGEERKGVGRDEGRALPL